MNTTEELLAYNKNWAEKISSSSPDYFHTLSQGQHPKFLWIGCSDSRVPDNEVTGCSPGEMFVHRNVANIVDHTDMNILSVIQYAVEVLKIRHIIVCGHYGCGGVKAAMANQHNGLIDNWLRDIKDVYRLHKAELESMETDKRFDRLVEFNVIENAYNVAKTSVVQLAWKNKMPLSIHGWVFNLRDGLLRDLGITVSENATLDKIYHFEDP